ncbi:MAG: XrtA/PEP-CTERM system histidine kinase PrsK [Stellaceae bacterium]
MGLSQGLYASCGAAFLGLIALMLLRGRISGPGIGIIGACALTATWAADVAMPGLLPRGASAILDSLRLSAWLILMVALIGLRETRRSSPPLPLVAAVGFCVLVVGYELAIFAVGTAAAEPTRHLHDFLRVGLAVGGLLAAENLLRNAGDARRRYLWPLCLALGATFAFELFLYADRLMIPASSPSIAGGRGLVGLFAVPLLAVAMARNREWRVDIHVSRSVVLYTAALMGSGVFFLALAAIGVLVREFGGVWGPPLQLLTLLGSAVVLTLVLGSRDIRIRLKQVIARHFFSHRYDYRIEWLRFVDTVSQPDTGEGGLPVRVIRALAQIVDSPAGTMWALSEGSGYVPQVAWNLPGEPGGKLSVDDPFITGFRGGTWIQERPIGESARWPFDPARAWLAVPLSHGNELIAFVVLSPAPHSYPLDWESFDLLRAAGRQAASYLAEERSTRALLDARLLNDYSKRFAFVVHDIKNLASQLGLVVSNARRHFEDAEFRADMLLTLEGSVARMNRLVAQLHEGRQHASPQVIEPDIVISTLAEELSTVGTPIETRLGARACRVAINGEQFRSVLSHLINNAREAAQSAAVVVASRSTVDRIIIDVVDRGPGMDADFIRNELFQPFHSTKAGGLGIGAYQTRELLRMAGGELEVISEKGVGTIMRVTFPMRGDAQLTPTAA